MVIIQCTFFCVHLSDILSCTPTPQKPQQQPSLLWHTDFHISSREEDVEIKEKTPKNPLLSRLSSLTDCLCNFSMLICVPVHDASSSHLSWRKEPVEFNLKRAFHNFSTSHKCWRRGKKELSYVQNACSLLRSPPARIVSGSHLGKTQGISTHIYILGLIIRYGQ